MLFVWVVLILYSFFLFFFFLSEDSKRLFLFIIFYSRSIIPFFFSFPRPFSKQNLLLVILVFVSLFFFSIYCALSSVCAFFLMCVFSFRFSVYFFFFLSIKKKKTLLLNGKRKKGEKALQLEWHDALRLFFF